ncbi:MAG: hypothetical protein NWE93_14925 [Candidatus Bathyarchaeota archaeon]|nr:hypothetical protein [Candidatus Bathyarchaeota archaeon]
MKVTNKKYVFIFILVLCNSVTAQKAELLLKLTQPDGQNASGSVLIQGDTTISDNQFISPETYILKNITGIDDYFVNVEDIVLAGNPSSNGIINLIFRNFQEPKGIVSIFDLKGALLGKLCLPEELSMTIRTNPGLHIITFSDASSGKSFKVINTSCIITLNIIREHETLSLDAKKNLYGKGTGAVNEYTVDFSNSNLDYYTQAFSVAPGSIFTIDKSVNWSLKVFLYSANTNTGTKVTVKNTSTSALLDEETTATGTLAKQTLQERFDNTKGINLEYLLTGEYTDTARILKTQFINDEVVLDTLRRGHFYVTINGNGQTYTLRRGSTVLATASVGQQSLFKVQGDQTSIDAEVSGTGLVTKTVPLSVIKGITAQTINLDPAERSHALTVNALSSILGKTIKNGTMIYKVNTANPSDTAWVSVTSGAAYFNWNDNTQTETIKVGSRAVPGHSANEITFLMDDNETRNITFTGNLYSAIINFLVQNQFSENVSGASISGGDAAVTTGANGKATAIKSNLLTDVNNVPYASYSFSFTITKSNIQTSTQNVSVTAGTNPEKLLSVVQEYEHWLYGTATSPNGALARAWKDGTLIQSATVSGNSYATAHIKRITKTFTADSVTISMSNYVTFKQTGVVFVDGGTKLEATLQRLYSHWLYGTATSPDGTLVRGWKNGEPIYSATVSGNAYETAHTQETSATVALDSLTFELDGYARQSEVNVTLAEGANKKEATLTRIPLAVRDFYVIVYNVQGDLVPNFTQTYTLADGTVKTFTSNAQGIMHINFTEYDTLTEKAIVDNTSSEYNDLQIYQKLDQALSELNYSQTPAFNGLPQVAELNMHNLPDTLALYVVEQNIPTPEYLVGTYGTIIPVDHAVIRDMMGGRNNGKTTKFMSTASVPTIEVVQFLFNYTTGAAIEQTQIDRAAAELNKILTIYTLNNGKKLMNYTSYQISNFADSRWQAIVARGGTNCTYTTFYTGSPYNGVTLTTTNSPNGERIIKSSNSTYSTGSTNGQISSEVYESINSNNDPPEDTTPWIYTSTGEITEAGKIIARIIYTFNPGTPTN